MIDLRKATEETVLILAPTYNDAKVAISVLATAGIKSIACADLKDLCDRLKFNYGAVIVSEEAVSIDYVELLQSVLKQQKTWSDIPIILLTGSDVIQATKLFSSSGNISLLERPFSQLTLIRSVEVALRARRKQYEVRYLLDVLQKSKDEAERANLAKTQFLANMSHEIRTPIGAILGFTSLVKNSSNSIEENLKYMTIVERNSQQLLRLIDDILDLSKVEAGKMTIEKIQFNFIEWLTDFNSVMLFKALDKKINFDFNLKTQIPNLVITDPVRLRQIISNVVGNAIKFTEKGSVQVSVEFNNPILQFVVKDTGVGITTEQSTKLFQAFSQADTSTTRKFGGTGLGLILSKRLSEMLGGDLVLTESKIGKGSVFTITTTIDVPSKAIMLTKINLQETPAVFSEQEKYFNKLKGLNVLLVEDSPDNQQLIQAYLSKSGVNLKTASDGLEGVEVARKENFDVILMDIQMPNLDGHEATQYLRKLKYGKPIVALTAHAMSEERARCFASGFTDFLTKPIQKDLLIEVLSRYVTERH